MKKTLQYRATVTGGLICGVYALIYLSSQIYFLAGNILVLDPSIKPLYSVILLVGINASLAVIVGRNVEIRKALVRLLCCRSSAIVPLQAYR